MYKYVLIGLIGLLSAGCSVESGETTPEASGTYVPQEPFGSDYDPHEGSNPCERRFTENLQGIGNVSVPVGCTVEPWREEDWSKPQVKQQVSPLPEEKVVSHPLQHE